MYTEDNTALQFLETGLMIRSRYPHGSVRASYYEKLPCELSVLQCKDESPSGAGKSFLSRSTSPSIKARRLNNNTPHIKVYHAGGD